ncbi:Lambda phage tail tape-measure protein (Tape_meas_lam_C) [Roseovarius gaetbuli]|uniref:Lambda phage tail tape-measure protein (Tape_meas_lam_C) n=1 Tax=Roseovarius gaetbuli TaxID=1356575 RepID=A0A1X6ZU05_9RHOB|nr:phage tail tape measure C-terminal domain-containing protein [Roseovarius gaetbuli]SLN61592.1 Lambda phage tail tape-measure protein (Tape_meas_lam_C) [Roseovarius gaetbuli]
MAEKRVSVRLVAEGGRQVRAELEGVGEAGARGFGRLSREMDLANARVAAFARRARVAAAAATVALAAAGAAMIRSGLQTVDAQAKLAQSLGTTVASIQTLERAGALAGVSMSGIDQATKDLTRRLSQAAAGTGPAADALDRLGLSASDLIALPLDQRVGAINAAIESFVPAAERAAVAGQLFGEEGSIAMSRIDTATLRQATEDVLAFGVVVSEADADQIERTNDAISRLGLIWRGVSNQLAVAAAPALEAVANAMAAIASRTGPLGIAISALFDNIGRLISIAATFATLLAGRWVAGLAAAALSVRGLATALVVLRGALIRTGLGALIVGAGELVFQFTRLVSGAGGFGAAMGLLKDVAVEVWERLGMAASAAGAAATAVFLDLKSDAASAMQSAIESVVGFGNTAANTFEGAFEAIKAIWGLLPAAIGDLAFQAANSLIEGVEAMLNGVVARINGFIDSVNTGLEALGSARRITLLGDLDLGSIENRFAGAATQAATAAKDAFERAFADNPLAVPDVGLNDIAKEALASASIFRTAATDLAAGARAPLASWQALKDAVAGAGAQGETELDAARDAANRFDEAITEAGRNSGGAGAAAANGAEVAKVGWEAAVSTLADYAAKARDIGGDIGQSLVGAFQSAENAVGNFVKTGKLDFGDLVSSMIADLANLAARRFILGPIANALSDALGGAGGLFANILHAGGVVGSPGPGRMVPALAFANAPRMRSGGFAGLRPDEVPAILQRGERVLSRREAAGYGQGQSSTPAVNVTIMARDAESFRQSRTQVASDIARAVSLGQRGL